MQLAGKIIGGFVILSVLIVLAAPLLISQDVIVENISEQVKQNTGRELRVNGDYSLSVFPSLSIELSEVAFSNFAESAEPHMATMGQLVVHIPWLSVFSGELKLEKFVIEDLNLLLEKTKQGKANWDMFSGQKTQEISPKNTSSSTTSIPEAFDISLGQVEIVSGTITYKDAQNQSEEKLENLALQLILPSLRQPFELRGSLLYKKETFQITSVLDSPIMLIEGKTFDTSFALTSQLLNLNYSGKVEQTPFSLDGEVSLAGTSLKALSKWHGQVLVAKEDAFNNFSLATQVTFKDNRLSLPNLNAQLDNLNINGNSVLELSTPVNLTATINLGDLDINPYLPEPSVVEVPKEESKVPIVWDETAIDLSALSMANLDLVVTSESVKARDIKLGKNQFSLTLQNSLLTLQMDEFQAYQGQGEGKIVIDGASKPYRLSTEFNLINVNVQPLLTDAIKFERLMGTGKLQWTLEAVGNSQKQFISTLDGTFGFDLVDGAVQGANIAAIAKSASNIMQGNLAAVSLDTNFSKAEKTDFASLTGSFQFSNGVGENKDLALLNPLVRVTGNGSIDLPNTKLDFRTRSKLVSSIEGQGGKVDESGITIPIKIKGPFHDVQIKPDVSSEAKDKLKDKVKDKLKSLFGG